MKNNTGQDCNSSNDYSKQTWQAQKIWRSALRFIELLGSKKADELYGEQKCFVGTGLIGMQSVLPPVTDKVAMHNLNRQTSTRDFKSQTWSYSEVA